MYAPPQVPHGNNAKDVTVKPILSIAMHPSGYYMAAGFIDRVRIMHVLDDELREYRTLDHRSCNKMKFSTGGQYLIIVEQKNFFIYASYTLECLAKIKSPSTFISSIAFNDNDTYFGMVSADGFVYRYDLVNFRIKGDVSIDRGCDFRSCMFIQSPGTGKD